MGSKAKSGMSAVRQYPETVTEPPNTYVVGDGSFTSAIRDGKGHAEYHVGVVNGTAFTVQVQHSWRSTGVFTEDQSVSSVLDPVSGLHVVDIVAPVTKRYLKVVVTAPAPGLDADFEFGFYFQPRASGPISTSAAGGGGGSNVAITGVTQVQNIETVTPLGAGGTVSGASRDCLSYESFGVSVFLDPDAGQALNCTLLVENSSDGVTWRTVDSVTLAGAADATVVLNRVYSVCRRYYRASLTNNDALNALDATELNTMMKPI